MAKNSRNSHSSEKSLLEKKIPMWKASFENASKFYKESESELDISFDETQLKAVVAHIHGDDTKTVSNWVEKFAKLCGDLSKYQSSLNDEYKSRCVSY